MSEYQNFHKTLKCLDFNISDENGVILILDLGFVGEIRT